MPCCTCCCGGVDCTEGQLGKCCCGGPSGTCCEPDERCIEGVCVTLPPCGGQQVAETGATFDSRTFAMPFEGGTVTFQYEAFNIPDQFEVYFGNTLAFTTGGLISGEATVQLEKPVGTTSATVIVTASSTNTAWEYAISCPESPLP